MMPASTKGPRADADHAASSRLRAAARGFVETLEVNDEEAARELAQRLREPIWNGERIQVHTTTDFIDTFIKNLELGPRHRWVPTFAGASGVVMLGVEALRKRPHTRQELISSLEPVLLRGGRVLLVVGGARRRRRKRWLKELVAQLEALAASAKAGGRKAYATGEKMMRIKIEIPSGDVFEGPWTIHYPFLKLSLKYGYLGTWTPNWSLAFDTYASTRGPRRGLPNLVDFTSTMLMNSRARATDLKTLASWLAVAENVARLESVRSALASAESLAELNARQLRTLGGLLDGMIRERELPGVRMAKIAKWLAAWAPAHVPMIDQHVYRVMTKNARRGVVSMTDVLIRFQKLLVANHEGLTYLAELLTSRLDGPKGAITPVRVLDSLLWFDWWAIYAYASDFRRWLAPNNARNARCHLIREAGAVFAASQGIE